MKRLRKTVLLSVLAGAVTALVVIVPGAWASSSAERAQRDVYIDFRMPSNNIFCAYVVSSSPSPTKYLRCDIMSGLKPKPSSKGCIEGDLGSSVSMGLYGKAQYNCVSDTVYNTKARKLAYGTTWRKGGFVCKSRTAGLTCTNKGQHGFFLSKERSYCFRVTSSSKKVKETCALR